jgi:hypothetical protein
MIAMGSRLRDGFDRARPLLKAFHRVIPYYRHDPTCRASHAGVSTFPNVAPRWRY